MKRFNDEGWRCHRCTYDPALFYIQRGVNDIDPKDIAVRYDQHGNLNRNLRPAQEEAWVSIHTDDCDAVGSTNKILEDIYQIMNTKWTAKVVDPSFLLGVH